MGRELKDGAGKANTLKRTQVFINNVPTSSQGKLGDKAGDTIITSDYLYRCIQDFSTEDAWTIRVAANISGYVTGSGVWVRGSTTPVPDWALPEPVPGTQTILGSWEIVGDGDFVTPAPLVNIYIPAKTGLAVDDPGAEPNMDGIIKYYVSANVSSEIDTNLTVRRVTAPEIWRRMAWSGDTW